MNTNAFRKRLSLAFLLIGICFLLLAWKFWENPIWAGIFVGLGASIIVWLFIEFFFGIFDMQHYEITQKIFAIVKGERISPIEYPRGKRDNSYYEEQFSNSEEIFISGIAVRGVLSSLINTKSLLHKRIKSGLKVKILFVHPDSLIVDQRKKYTSGEIDIKDTIQASINEIEQLKENLILEHPPSGELIIKITKRPLYTSIFASRNDYGSEGKHGVLLINPIFSHQRGDASIQFELSNPKDGKLLDIYNTYISCFKENFRDVEETSTICTWSSNGIR